MHDDVAGGTPDARDVVRRPVRVLGIVDDPAPRRVPEDDEPVPFEPPEGVSFVEISRMRP